ncbi:MULTISPECIES: DinB family protein [Brevibacillus]|jgi:uncharacterized damage-inducible protein DinB|uniref:DinB-like domain-containing protein n=1 Tax=Brevibacillus borstelensis AK1 TaxID=1300222 RepID=M8E8W4_9BACL|nr:DinB family protein [Brevibacillus borstelensis]EMT51920.1 hypothetical protein I532_13783 [Brevibacillus borstelensis AK1]KKX56474.1 hypothetical protein X546_03470 [Brevibacillus borstelensis cifa_chp40]MBE5398275.1 DinB family protein [Brevibacillus borstelensis]MCC0564759.1 DinB family protein [Brevibacillus borstelensis]MCM3468805.1 DinB family protein [Brevibacillus borstelensis]
MSQNIVNTAKSVRQIVLHQVQSIPEELFDAQPPQFTNTIRWNVGHIVFCLESFLSLGFPDTSRLPESYAALFNTGTKPSDWTAEPPTKEELVEHLSEQLARIAEIAPGKLEEPLKSPVEMGPLRFTTVGEVVNFAIVHEAMHSSTISSLLKVVQYGK